MGKLVDLNAVETIGVQPSRPSTAPAKTPTSSNNGTSSPVYDSPQTLSAVTSILVPYNGQVPPIVLIVDNDGNIVETDVEYGVNSVYISFPQQFFGTLYLR